MYWWKVVPAVVGGDVVKVACEASRDEGVKLCCQVSRCIGCGYEVVV